MLPLPVSVRFLCSILLIITTWYPYFSYDFLCAKKYFAFLYNYFCISFAAKNFKNTEELCFCFTSVMKTELDATGSSLGLMAACLGTSYCVQQLLL